MHLLFLACVLPSVLAAARPRAVEGAPTVRLDRATFAGFNNGTVSEFLGIPFAESTTGRNRFNLPVPVAPYTGTHDATSFGPACPQQSMPTTATGMANLAASNSTSEDCLSVNVVKPVNIKEGDRLPVVVWIYGGGFEAGSSSMYDGSIIVDRSIAINQPIIFVSLNYRLAAWGFLASKEVKEAGIGNVGLQDQRQAFRWVQKYIADFGGDPSKVTIWGESAGAVSVALQMVTNGGNTERLFQGAFMQSGAPTPVGDITHGQPFYDMLVNNTGCAGSQNTLECMRGVSEEILQNAVDLSPSISGPMSLNLAWQPRADGRFLREDPQQLTLSGSVANIPFINGNNDDEGTIFTLQLTDITTDDEFTAYIKETYFSAANQSIVDTVAQLYPSDPAAGSPFDTGTANAVTPEFKRLAAFQGDLVFQAPRRVLINKVASRQPVWSFLNKRLKSTPEIGSFHGSDLEQTIFAHAELQDYLINFINNLDPNIGSKSAGESSEGLIEWPRFSVASQQLLTILDGDVPLNITKDDFRQEAINFLIQAEVANPI